MLWIPLALVSAFAIATNDTLQKKLLLKNVSPYLLAGAQFLIAGTILFAFIIYTGFPEVDRRFYGAMLVTGILNIAATILGLRALRTTDVSLVAPMIAFTPVFLIFTSYFILKEIPSPLGILGILLIVGGSYILHQQPGKNSYSLKETWKRIRSTPGSMLMLAVALIFSITSNFDKLAVVYSSPLFASGVLDVFLGVSFFTLTWIFRKSNISTTPKFSSLLVIGAIFALGTWAANTALSLAIVPYVISMKRASVIISILLGHFIFKEQHLRFRLVGGLVMLTGIILISFS